jgi:hypothetical protein
LKYGRIQDSGFRVQDSGFRIQDSGGGALTGLTGFTGFAWA